MLLVAVPALMASLAAMTMALAGPPPGWQSFEGKFVALEAGTPLAGLATPTPLSGSEGSLLFAVGKDYQYKADPQGRLRLLAGDKTIDPTDGKAFKIAGHYPGESGTVPLAFRLLPQSGETPPALVPAQALVVRFGKRSLSFIDLDANGYFDDFGIDATIEGDPESLKKEGLDPNALRSRLRMFQGHLEVGDQHFLATLRPAPKLLAWPMAATVREDYRRHMGWLNHLRRQHGAPPVGLDETLSAGCEQHSAYCAKHGLTHEEDPAEKLYTPEGAQAGKRGVVGHSDDAEQGLREMFGTFYHRTYFLWPELTRVGVGVRDGRYTCDVLTHVKKATRTPLTYPFDRQTGVELRAKSESPDPRPEGLEALQGSIITVAFTPGTKPHLVEARIIDLSSGQDLPYAASTPAQPPPAARERFPDNDASIGLCPREPLRPLTIYEVRLRYATDAAKAADPRHVQGIRWRFQTGR